MTQHEKMVSHAGNDLTSYINESEIGIRAAFFSTSELCNWFFCVLSSNIVIQFILCQTLVCVSTNVPFCLNNFRYHVSLGGNVSRRNTSSKNKRHSAPLHAQDLMVCLFFVFYFSPFPCDLLLLCCTKCLFVYFFLSFSLTRFQYRFPYTRRLFERINRACFSPSSSAFVGSTNKYLAFKFNTISSLCHAYQWAKT